MSDVEIREQIARYIEGNIIAQELEDRLENETWGLESEPARTLAATVLRLLAEHGHGDWTDTELREQLGAISRFYWFDQAPKTAWSGSEAAVIRQDQQSEAAGRWRVAESV